jgi:hypothetical protein
VWSITGRLLEMLQANILDLPYLITDPPTTLHVATQLSQWNCAARLTRGRDATNAIPLRSASSRPRASSGSASASNSRPTTHVVCTDPLPNERADERTDTTKQGMGFDVPAVARMPQIAS